jgi:hypothetical protein
MCDTCPSAVVNETSRWHQNTVLPSQHGRLPPVLRRQELICPSIVLTVTTRCSAISLFVRP